ncbi:hypothetical protein GCM10027269_74210 [Kribbella endophytica]
MASFHSGRWAIQREKLCLLVRKKARPVGWVRPAAPGRSQFCGTSYGKLGKTPILSYSIFEASKSAAQSAFVTWLHW